VVIIVIYYTTECVSCGFPCKYKACPYYEVKHFKCDRCKDKDVILYHYDNEEICEECLLKEFEIVEGSDEY
jgi:hypothetical protein